MDRETIIYLFSASMLGLVSALALLNLPSAGQILTALCQ